MWILETLAIFLLVLILASNAIFYAIPVVGVVKGSRLLKKRTVASVLGGIAVIAVGFAPLIYWGVLLVTELDFPARRAAEVASWPREPVTAENRPDTIFFPIGDYASALVATGVFDIGYSRGASGNWLVYRLKDRPGCPISVPEAGSWSSVRRAVAECVDETTTESPPTGSYLTLTFGSFAPSRLQGAAWRYAGDLSSSSAGRRRPAVRLSASGKTPNSGNCRSPRCYGAQGSAGKRPNCRRSWRRPGVPT